MPYISTPSQEQTSLRLWAEQMYHQSLSTKAKEKQMPHNYTPHFDRRSDNRYDDVRGERIYSVWVETTDLDGMAFKSDVVELNNTEVNAHAGDAVWDAQAYRLHELMHREGRSNAPLPVDITTKHMDFDTDRMPSGAIRYRGCVRLPNGCWLGAESFISYSDYQEYEHREAAVNEIKAHLFEIARQRLSATINAFKTVDYSVLAAYALMTWVVRYTNPAVLRAQPPEEIMQYKAAPIHQATFYRPELYSPKRAVETINHLIPVLRRSRPWFFRESTNYKLHESLAMAMVLAAPDDWHNLILEWPHQAVGNKTMIAYTRDERAGENDKQTVTSVGKYIKRHFSSIPDHEIRNIASTFVADVFKFVDTTNDMIYEIQRGAQSCMNWRGADASEHPYNAYDPKYGWHMAIRLEGDKPMGRALCMHDKYSGDKFFVRSYRSVDGGYSPADEVLEAWLRNQNYEKRDGWEGCTLKYIPRRGLFLAPYLDGCHQNVSRDIINGEQCLVINDDGEYVCNNTDGAPDEREERPCCEHCDEHFDDGDGYWVGRNEDTHICSYCFDNNYVSALGRGGQEYYINTDEAIWVESQDQHYHDQYLCDNDIVQTAGGEYEHQDDCVYIERHGDWYHNNDEAVQYCEHDDAYELTNECEQLTDGKWAHMDDVWCCAHSGEFYLLEDKNRECHMTSDGNFVYVDYLEEYEQALADNAANAANQSEVI